MMSAKNLRDSILQMAVEGKLVEQRKEEGTAEDLLASIREQRAQLVREKKAKPVKGGGSLIWRDDDGHWFERRGKGEAVCIDEEIPFDIPDSWCWARVDDICENIVDCPHSTPRYEKSETAYCAIDTNCINDNWEISGFRYINGDDFEKRIQRLRPRSGDLVFTREGSIGRSVLLPDGNMCLGQRVMLLRAGKLFLNRYLQICLTAPFAFVLYKLSKKGTAAKHINVKDVCSFLIPLPPLAEQYRIAAKIDGLLPHVEEYGKVQERREQLDRELPIRLRKSILQAAVEGKLTEQSDDDEPASVLLAGIREKRAQLVREGKAKPVKGGESTIYRDDASHWFERRGKSDPVCIDEEIPFDIPDTWCWARLESVCNFGTCANIEYEEVPEGTWNLDLEDLEKNTGFILQKKRKRVGEKGSTKHVFKAGEVLYSKLRPYLNKVAIADEDGVCTSEILPLRIEGIETRYVQLFLMSPYFVAFANSHVSGTKMPRLKVADGRRCLMPVPPLEEQDRLVEKVRSLFSNGLEI